VKSTARALVPSVRPQHGAVRQATPFRRATNDRGTLSGGFTRYSRVREEPIALLTAADTASRRNGRRTAPHVSTVYGIGRRANAYVSRVRQEHQKQVARLHTAQFALKDYMNRKAANRADLSDGHADMPRLKRAQAWSMPRLDLA